jgi:hypothetical protein
VTAAVRLALDDYEREFGELPGPFVWGGTDAQLLPLLVDGADDGLATGMDVLVPRIFKRQEHLGNWHIPAA